MHQRQGVYLLGHIPSSDQYLTRRRIVRSEQPGLATRS
jgi:hypothetical protein